MYATGFIDWPWLEAGASEAEVKASVDELLETLPIDSVKVEIVMPAAEGIIPMVRFRAWLRSDLVKVLQAEDFRWGNALSHEDAMAQLVEVASA